MNAIRDRFIKKPGHKKAMGIALGERSLLVAEVIGGDRPTLTHSAEMVYPEGITPASPAELGAALAGFLEKEAFSAKSAIVGLPARWLVTQPKEVPAADARTVVEMLRLSAEAEFSTELKDLVYDFTGAGTSVLLVATPKKYVEAATAMCQAANLNLDSVTATALALGDATGRGAARDCLVLAVASGGGEMTMQRDAASGALRHLRAPDPQAPFINELRRTVSSMPSGKAGREMILWDGTGLNAKALSDQIGIRVRSGDFPLLGITGGKNGASANGASNGDGTGRYAAAIALALQGISDHKAPVDFLHSRLAPPIEERIPRWAIIAGAAVVLFIALTVFAFHNLEVESARLDDLQKAYDSQADQRTAAESFVADVSLAQAWHGGDPRYLTCIRDMTAAMQEDFDTFSIGLIIGDAPRPPNAKTPDTHALAGVLSGRADDQPHVLALLNRLRKIPGFDAKLGNSDAGHNRDVSFSIIFNYQFSKPRM